LHFAGRARKVARCKKTRFLTTQIAMHCSREAVIR